MKRVPILVLVMLILAAPMPASAAATTVTSFGDWTVLRDTEGGRQICFIGSQPKSAEGDYQSRGQAYVLVTLRPAEKPHGVVSIEAGYPYAKDNDVVKVSIDDQARFELFTRNRPEDGKGDAWAFSDDDDKALIAAMKAGSRMIVEGRSKRGTDTKDTYSLSGFTRAHRAMEEACGL